MSISTIFVNHSTQAQRSCEFVWGYDLFWHSVSPGGWSDTFRRFGRGKARLSCAGQGQGWQARVVLVF
jgi:hypothetical protein